VTAVSYPFAPACLIRHALPSTIFMVKEGDKEGDKSYPWEILFSSVEPTSEIRGLKFQILPKQYSSRICMAMSSTLAARQMAYYLSVHGVRTITVADAYGEPFVGVSSVLMVHLGLDMLPWWNAVVPHNTFTAPVHDLVLMFEELHAPVRLPQQTSAARAQLERTALMQNEASKLGKDAKRLGKKSERLAEEARRLTEESERLTAESARLAAEAKQALEATQRTSAYRTAHLA